MTYKMPSLSAPVELRVIMADVVGYVVMEGGGHPEMYRRTLAAFTTADEAAEFVKRAMGRRPTTEAAE
jgi:hypothetical protein